MTLTRADSKEKWYVFMWLNTLWVASYQIILSPSPLQYEMMDTFDLSDGQFALYASIVYLSAACISLFCPYIIGKLNVYNTMTLSTTLVTIGDIIFILGIFGFMNNSIDRILSLIIQYFGMILAGISFGIQNICIYTIINVWFKGNQWMEFVINFINMTFNIGIIIPRYCFLPLYRVSGDNFIAPYSLPLVSSTMSIFACLMMRKYENMYISRTEQALIINADETADMSMHIDLDTDLLKIQHFNIKTWLLIFYITIGYSVCETRNGQFTLPMMMVFNISEDYANLLLSVLPIFGLIFGLPYGWIISKFGYLSYYLIGVMLCYFISTFIMQISDGLDDIQSYTKDANYINGWISTIFAFIAYQGFWGSAYGALFTVTPKALSSVTTSVCTVFTLIGCMFQGYLFGFLVITNEETENKNYKWSLWMLNICILIGLLIAIIVHIMDLIEDGPLHKSAKHKLNKMTNTDYMAINESSPLVNSHDHDDDDDGTQI